MKKITLSFLTLLMLLPSLVCFMAFCAMPQQAHAAVISSGNNETDSQPCHESGAKDKKAADGIMMVQDCMGVDFFTPDVTGDTALKTANMDNSIPYFGADYAAIGYPDMKMHSSRAIRGPPSAVITHGFYLPVYMTTRRIRI